MADKKSSPERDAARAAALADDPCFDSALVDFNGCTYQVRAPSLAAIKAARRAATHDGEVDQEELSVRLVIASTYTKLGERVFEDADLAAMMNRPSTSAARLLQALGGALRRLQEKAGLEAAEKNSESAPS